MERATRVAIQKGPVSRRVTRWIERGRPRDLVKPRPGWSTRTG